MIVRPRTRPRVAPGYRRYNAPLNYKYSLFHNYQYSYSLPHIKRKFVVGREQHLKIVKKAMGKVFNHVLDEPDGVHIKGLGYFFMFMSPITKKVTFRDRRYTNEVGREYFPIFQATGTKNPLSHYYIPYSSRLRKSSYERVSSGQLYKFNLSKLFVHRENMLFNKKV